ncbi:MAG: hypothetical protein JO138_13195 [Acidobacteriaceae bacterium]|nr:hypothetical protein [Acidobacteriaceae bacterium]
MGTINSIKQLAEADTPLLFFNCILPSGDPEFWCTHATQFNGNQYAARILKYDLFDLQLSADDAMDGISQLSLTLANADSALSQLNSVIGFKGSQLTVYFAFADLTTGSITTESTVLFRGVASDPDEITEDSLALSFTNKLALQRIPLPEVRVQRACPWNFPTSAVQRLEASSGGTQGKYSRFYRCGYSADVAGGVGNLNGGQPYTACDKSRTQCLQRGMFSSDENSNVTRRFGGFEFVPSAILVRTAGDKTSHLSPLLDSSATYNDPVPIVYGTGWLKAPIVFGRNDGNLTHLEALLGMGTVGSVLKVVVNDVEIPLAVQGQDMTTTGWYTVVTNGGRTGNFNLDFSDANGNPLGDPNGSISVLSVVVPNRISSGKSLPNIEVLLRGMQLDSYNADSTFQQTSYTNNPAWVILDVLRRCGWALSDLNLASFATSAAFCQELINTTDLNGNPLQVPRYECNLVLTKRQSAAVVLRGIRVASSLMLRYGSTGLLELVPETTLSAQQPSLPDGSNSTEPLNDGWPAYEFSDASGPFSGIVRNLNGTSTVRLISRSISETSNRLSVEFQDESNEYQQDSLSLADSDDSALIGYEISSQSTALGIANFSQATRVLLRQLGKSTGGNVFIEFQTSFRALKVRPGDIIAFTYAKEGFLRVPFRVTKLSPSMNYQLVTVLTQIHKDDWYSDNPTVLGGAGRQPATQVGTPRPLIGTVAHNDASGALEFFDFGIQENIEAWSTGAATDTISVAFTQPAKPTATSPSVPLLSLAPTFSTTGGTIAGGSTFYYAVSAVDSAGDEGPLSFTVPVLVPEGTNTNSVSITGLSFPSVTGTFHVYRGVSPQMLYRIASNVPLATSYTDTGLSPEPVGPPDPAFDHANFYYRYEYAGPFSATLSSPNTIGSADMGASARAYIGMAVRIIEGTGRGQERTIVVNDATTLTVNLPWSTMPDLTSIFVISEASWRFGAVSVSSPAQFEVGYSAGTVVQVSGRSANVSNQECDPELCPLTRFALGASKTDLGEAGSPTYSLGAPGGGILTIFQVGFEDLTNTTSVTSGTLTLFYWNELSQPSQFSLAAEMDAFTTTVTLSQTGPATAGAVIQIGSELMTVVSSDQNADTYTVVRGALESLATAHSASDTVLHLSSTVAVVPFAPGFFENKASGNFLHTMNLPDVRICASEFFVTNALGTSQATQQCYTGDPDGGLRTLSGGQFSMQVAGYLATQTDAAPPLMVEASHAVRDIRATVTQAPSGCDAVVTVEQDGGAYCSLTIPSDSTHSNVIDGASLPYLREGSALTMDIALQINTGDANSFFPGRELTLTIRL